MSDAAWTQWQRVEMSAHQRRMLEESGGMVPDHVWANNRYEVWAYELGTGPRNDHPAMVWLSIKRTAREVVRDWRELQRIKNELVGPECEAVELFPAESRLVDTSNQYHLFCLKDRRTRFPFGYPDRCVVIQREGVEWTGGARQEPHGPTHPVPADGIDAEEAERILRNISIGS